MTTSTELKSELAKVDQLLYATWLQERDRARLKITELAVEFPLSISTVLKDVEAALLKADHQAPFLHRPKVDLPLRKQGVARYIEIKYLNPATGTLGKAAVRSHVGCEMRLKLVH